MDSSFTPIEQMLKFRASRHEDFPYQEILLTRLCMHMPEILHGDMVQPLRVKVDREARRLAGYRYGRQIADDFLTQLGQGEEQVARWLEAENDPRLNEIVSHLNHVVEEARIR